MRPDLPDDLLYIALILIVLAISGVAAYFFGRWLYGPF